MELAVLWHRGPGLVFLNFHCFTKYVKWLSSAARRCVLSRPASQAQKVRYLDIHENDQFDETQLAAWVKQASQLPANECERRARDFLTRTKNWSDERSTAVQRCGPTRSSDRGLVFRLRRSAPIDDADMV